MQLEWSPIAECFSQKCHETGMLIYKGKIKTIILIFSDPKSQTCNEEKNFLIAKAFSLKSHFVNES